MSNILIMTGYLGGSAQIVEGYVERLDSLCIVRLAAPVKWSDKRSQTYVGPVNVPETIQFLESCRIIEPDVAVLPI